MTRRVVVIGAGFAGLGAARLLRLHGVEVTVLERAAVVGGRARTVLVDGEPVDVGAQFVAPFYTGVLDAAHRCGLASSLHADRQMAAVLHDGVRYRVDSVRHIAASDLLPVGERLRLPLLAIALLRAWRHLDPHDLGRAARLDVGSADRLLSRYVGPVTEERLVLPLLQSLLYWDLPRTSAAMLLLLLKVAPASRSVFRLDGGLGRLASVLAADVDVRVGTEVTAVDRDPAGGWTVRTGAGAELPADGVVCATTASVAARLLDPVAPEVARRLRSVTYSRTVAVTCRVPGRAAARSNLLFTTSAAPHVAAVTVPTRAPSAVVRVFLRDSGVEALGGLDDDALATRALRELRDAGVTWAADAVPVDVCRWDEALPRFEPGSMRGWRTREVVPAGLEGFALAGDYLGGPFLEGAWASGLRAARRLLEAW